MLCGKHESNIRTHTHTHKTPNTKTLVRGGQAQFGAVSAISVQSCALELKQRVPGRFSGETLWFHMELFAMHTYLLSTYGNCVPEGKTFRRLKSVKSLFSKKVIRLQG